jgi:cytochrome c2
MPSYAQQVPVDDRWAIVAYIRALQASQNVSEEEMAEYDINLSDITAEFQATQDAEAEKQGAEADQNAGVIPTAELGQQFATQYACSACHNTTGDAGGIGPSWKNLFGSQAEVINEAGEYSTITVDADYIIESIINPAAKKSRGYEAGFMMAYDNLAEHELQSIVEYIKTLSDN